MGFDNGSSDAKMAMAYVHRRVLGDEIAAWIKGDPYEFVRKHDRHFKRFAVVVQIKTPPNLGRWALRFGDCVHNIRCALDHLVYAILSHEQKGSIPTNVLQSLGFVIETDAGRFSKTMSRRHLDKLLSSDVQAAMERVQPYNRPHAELQPLLKMLRDLDNIDKHHTIPATMQVMRGERQLVIPARLIEETKPRLLVVDQGVENGAEVAAFTVRRPAPHMQYDFNGTIDIAIGHRPGPGGVNASPIIFLLDMLLAEVIEVIDSIKGKVR